MKRGWILLIALLLVLGAASFTAARLLSAGRVTPGQTEPLFGMLQDYLQLTEEQRRHMADVDSRYAGERQRIRQRMWEARDDLAAVLRDPDSTRDQALAAMRRFGSVREEMAVNTLDYIFEVREVLNAQQKTKLADVMDRGICALTYGPGGGGCGRAMGGPGMGLGRGRRYPGWAR